MVAIMNGDSWPMFLCGFLGVFVVTQMHGLGLKRATLWGLGVAYIGLVAVLYSQRGWGRATELLAVSGTEWGMVLLLTTAILALQFVWRQLASQYRRLQH